MGSAAPTNSDGGVLPPLAVIGMSFRFPGEASSEDGFWNMLMTAKCASAEVPPSRFNIHAHHSPDTNRLDTLAFRGGHFVEGDAGAFDAPFFGIPANEAVSMDPLHRIALEESFRALESAGLSLQDVAGTKTAVFSGCLAPDYVTITHKDSYALNPYHASGTSINMLANRVSWWFDLQGPSATVDTACSSSLVAMDLACQAIWAGDATMALVCGANMMMTPESQLYLSNLGMLSRDARSFSFDHRANGYARGEGVGVVVVQPLADALRDGHTIRAVVRSTCSNQDGKTPGITQPSKAAQHRLILDTYAKAGLSMENTRYFEGHGTGTPLGDPTEAGAIGASFRAHRSAQDPLYLGSVKGNIGHLEGGAGIAGMIKAILTLEAGVIPPNANFERLNARIDAGFLNLKIPDEPVPWPSTGLRRASVQSFGFGGSNSHVIMDDAYNFLRLHRLQGNHKTKVLSASSSASSSASASLNGKPQKVPRLLVWSTADEAGIARTKEAWRDHPSQAPDTSWRGGDADYLADVAYTLASRRTHLPWRAMAVLSSADDLSGVADLMSAPARAAVAPKLGFVFTGQGSQWHAMGRELIHHYDVFKTQLIDAGGYLAGLGCTWNPIDTVHVSNKVGDVEELMKSAEETNVNKPLYSQTLCTILQVALVELMRSFDVHPSAVVGHSSGEIAAAYAAGVLSRESAWKVAYCRGLVATQLARTSATKGSMLAVGLSRDNVQLYLDRTAAALGETQSRLTVACVNSPASVTVSGEAAYIDHVQRALEADKVFCRRLRVDVAYHSFQMLEVAEEYRAIMGSLEPPPPLPTLKVVKGQAVARRRRPVVAVASSVTGTWIAAETLSDPEYWVRNLVSPVLFSDALAAMCVKPTGSGFKKLDGSHRRSCSVQHLVEVGPHAALQGPVRDILRNVGSSAEASAYVSLLARKVSAVESVLQAVGRLHCLGHAPALASVNKDRPGAMMAVPSLPAYAFNHAKTYWYESRLSRGYRLRKFPVHQLLGAPEADFNPLEAKWRNIIRTGDLPWVEEHKISGTILYPAAGMLAMAIEAAKQLSDPGRTVEAFVIKNTNLHASIQLPANSPSAGVEVNLYMRPRRDQDEKDSGWHDFSLYTHDDRTQTWTENCTGSIQVVYAAANDRERSGIDQGREDEAWRSRICGEYCAMAEACPNMVDATSLYARLEECGYSYGPAFRAITSVGSDGGGGGVAEVRTFQPSGAHADHVVHPTTLDCIVQMTLLAITSGGAEKMATAIPTHFDRVWISATGLSSADADSVRAYGRASRLGLRQIETSIGAVDATGTRALLKIDGFIATNVSAGSDADASTTLEQQAAASAPLNHSVEWRPDLDILSDEQVLHLADNVQVLGPEDTISSEQAGFYADLDFLAMAYLTRATDQLAAEPEREAALFSNQMYLAWMRRRVVSSQPLANGSCGGGDDHHLSQVSGRVAAANKLGSIFTTIGSNLLGLLQAEEAERRSLVQAYYSELRDSSPGTVRFGRILDAIVHKKPDAHILEVGAGVGAVTPQMLKTLAPSDEAPKRFGVLDCTDADASVLEAAQKTYGHIGGSHMRFRVLDMKASPETQGFECGTYDVVVAAAVIQATSDWATTLKHCRMLLRPSDALRTPFISGLLEGWWLGPGPDPGVDEAGWGQLLRGAGFSEVHSIVPDFTSPACHESSFILATATKTPSASSKLVAAAPTLNIIHNAGGRVEAMALRDSMVVAELDAQIHVLDFDEALEHGLGAPEGSINVLLLELEQPVWSTIDQQTFDRLQKLLIVPSSRAIWVQQHHGLSPVFRLVDGVSRVLNSELDRPALTCLSLEGNGGALSPAQRGHIVQLCRQRLASPADALETTETEYAERGGVLFIPRLVAASEAEAEAQIDRRLRPRQHVTRPWYALGEVPLRMALGSAGLLNTLHWVEDGESSDDSPAAALGHDEVELRVYAAGINFRDLLTALGRVNHAALGTDVAGIVTRLGAGAAASGLHVGDRVAASYYNCFRSLARCPRSNVAHIPDGVSLTAGAAAVAAFITAWQALHGARVRPGETVLVHSAAGGTGQAAVQVAQHLGATVIGTVGTEAKKAFLVERYGLSPDHILSSRDTSFAQGVMRLTGGRGVDVILNSLSGDSLVASWECVAPFGRFVEIGKKDILAGNALPMAQFARNVSFRAYDLAGALATPERAAEACHALEEVLSLVAQGKMTPPEPVHVFSAGEIEKAFRSLQSGKTMGKIVVEFRPDEPVQALVNTKSSLCLDPDASYLIAGGLGGLGRGMARWLVDRGARNLILLSRSGPQTAEAAELVGELRSRGARVAAPACDISSAEALAAALAEAAMPPAKGCIQASMVLRDGAFERMAFDAWQASVAAKVAGTWNLHEALPRGMDFFIMLSSISAAGGNRGQANYAAGNAFQNALAEQRVAEGERATALGLGPFFDEGVMASDAALQARFRGITGVTMAELLALLDYHCDPSTRASRSACAPVTMRFAPGMESSQLAYFLRKPMFSHVAAALTAATGGDSASRPAHGSVDFGRVFASKPSTDEAGQVVANALAAKLADMLSLSRDEMDMAAPLHSFGIDSLVAVEIRNWLTKELRADIAIFDILGGASVVTLAAAAVGKTKKENHCLSAEKTIR
ncbi:hypothetical protein GQ53DRAFT_853631 [Thozetella sp. PMI_491]|nr:hypothetical protein GQ53DRAFT_853631 [Thozetella sp. PMI_491]